MKNKDKKVRSNPKQRITISLDSATMNIIDYLVKNGGVSRSEILDFCFDFAIRNHSDLESLKNAILDNNKLLKVIY